MILKTDKPKVIVAVFKTREDPGAGEMAQSLKCPELLFQGLGFHSNTYVKAEGCLELQFQGI